MAFNGEKTAFVGAGVMGEAMIKGLLKERLLAPENIVAADPRGEHLAALRERYGIEVTTDNAEAARAADVLVLSVKPQVMGAVLPELRGQVDGVRLILSIVAGVPLHTISESLLNVRVVRSMPNTPGQIGRGITVWTASPEVGAEERAQAEALLGAMGAHILRCRRALSRYGDRAERLRTGLRISCSWKRWSMPAFTWDSPGATPKSWWSRRFWAPCFTRSNPACIRRNCAIK